MHFQAGDALWFRGSGVSKHLNNTHGKGETLQWHTAPDRQIISSASDFGTSPQQWS